jgi:hypothetical protein
MFILNGELLRVWGNKDQSRDGAPFNRPTDSALAPNGEMYVSDGYGNSMVHRYSRDDEYLMSWGEKGSGPGQFDIPHDVWVQRNGVVIIADRQNNRIQFFTPEGDYINEWTGFARPCSVYVD